MISHSIANSIEISSHEIVFQYIQEMNNDK